MPAGVHRRCLAYRMCLPTNHIINIKSLKASPTKINNYAIHLCRSSLHNHSIYCIVRKYRMAQNFEGGILTNLTNFQQFVNIFSIKIFRLVSTLYEMNE